MRVKHTYYKLIHFFIAYKKLTCFLNKSACTAKAGSVPAIYCITSSIDHSLGGPFGCGIGVGLCCPVTVETGVEGLPIMHIQIIESYTKLYAMTHLPVDDDGIGGDSLGVVDVAVSCSGVICFRLGVGLTTGLVDGVLDDAVVVFSVFDE